MKNKTNALVVSLLGVALYGCGNRGAGVAFDAPSASLIVLSATPSALVATASNVATNVFNYVPFCTSNCTGAQSDYLGHLSNFVFKEAAAGLVEAPAYYLYWIDKAEDRLAEIKTRLGDADSTDTSACYNAESTAVNFSFPIGAQTLTLPMKFKCYSDITGPDGGTGKFLFGKDDNYFYMTDIYKDAGAGTTANAGQRIVFTRVSADGVDTDVWFLGDRYITGSGSYTGEMYNAQRVYANKTTKAFYWNKVEDPRSGGSGRDSIYAQSNGTDIYLEALYDSSYSLPDGTAKTATAVPGMGVGAGLCVSAANINTAGADCSGIDSNSIPERVGLTSPMHFHTWLGTTETATVTTEDDAFNAALDVIYNTDFAAAGVGKF